MLWLAKFGCCVRCYNNDVLAAVTGQSTSVQKAVKKKSALKSVLGPSQISDFPRAVGLLLAVGV